MILVGWIDAHVHLRHPGPVPSTEEIAVCRRLASAQGIERVHLLGNLISVGGYEPNRDDVRTVNAHTLAAMAIAPDFMSGLCYLNPEHGGLFCVEEMERCIVRGGMIGVKLWVAVNARQRALDPILARAASLDVPVLHHAWYKTVGHVAHESDPADIAALATRHPRTRIVMAHLGGGLWRGVRAIAGRTNVWVDTSGAQPEARLVEDAVRVLGAQRVLYGSDWPLRDFAAQTARITGARLTRREQEQILGGNARRVFR